MKRWIIYCHTHVDSGRKYVGLTSKTMMHRWNQHCAQAKSSKGGRWHFPNAIRKYGKDAFSHEVLEVCETVELANAAEERWIEKLDTRNPERGFNLMRGGASFPSDLKSTSAKLSEATKRNATPEKRAYLSSLRKGKPLSLETRAKISDSAKKNGELIAARNRARDPEMIVKFFEAGARARMFRTPETIQKIAEANRGKHLSVDRLQALQESQRNMSDESRERMKNSFKGRSHSEDARSKTSDAVRKQKRGSHGRYIPS